MYDIITFGSATRDIFLNIDGLKVIKGKSITGELLALASDSKIPVEDLYIRTGGGGTNTATTFINQGFGVAYCGAVGDDKMGKEVVDDLKNRGVDCSFISYIKGKQTNCSVVLSSPSLHRTNLVFRGASSFLEKKNISFNKLKKAKWFYFAPFAKENIELFISLVDFAFKNKIKVAVNPGLPQLLLPLAKLKQFLSKTDILVLNQEEASLLTKIPYQKEIEIFKRIDELCPGIAIMTKGGVGVTVSDGKYLYSAPSLRSKEMILVDATGAGDAFGSGFVAGLIRTNDIIKAIQLGMANSASCLSKWGAKDGLLKKKDKFSLVKVIVNKCGNNCLIKNIFNEILT
ncbi:MAG: carbohydrate kinase family protein [bacterium]